jgi:hypothetical protein
VEVVGRETRQWLHYLDGRVVPEPQLKALPVYVRG